MRLDSDTRTVWHLAGRACGPWPDDWRPDLERRLGHRPRRLGVWAEQALYGALRALESSGETALPADASLVVCSLGGPVQALQSGLQSLEAGQLPMPFTFLQSQPAVMLAALAAHLGGAAGWTGDAQAITHRDPVALLDLALRAAPRGGLLIGWIEDPSACKAAHRWLRLRPADPGLRATSVPLHHLDADRLGADAPTLWHLD